MKLEQIKEAIMAGDFTRQQVDSVVLVLQAKYAQIAQMEAMKFYPGQKVSWTHKGLRHEGTIERINQKTVAVTEENGRKIGEKWFPVKWRIPPSQLSAASNSVTD